MNRHILIANDDGIYSPGITALAKAASRFGQVRIVAPDVEQSSMGHAITASRPLHFRKTPITGFEAFRVNGTPADCVALGLFHWEKADLVLSGINLGLNVGASCWHSGTLAAARQAVLLGMRGIAFSTPVGEKEPDFDALEPFVCRTIELLLEEKELRLVNVNIPPAPIGIRWTRQSVRQYDGKVVATTDPSGRDLFWFTMEPVKAVDEGTDRWAVENQWVSVTPLCVDLTDKAELEQILARTPHGCDEKVSPAHSTPSGPPRRSFPAS